MRCIARSLGSCGGAGGSGSTFIWYTVIFNTVVRCTAVWHTMVLIIFESDLFSLSFLVLSSDILLF